jgi:hypothetical protein
MKLQESRSAIAMGFILEPKSGEDFVVNGWNWRPTMALLIREGVIPAGERSERCLANGCGGEFSLDESLHAAAVLEDLVSKMNAEQRVLPDGEITDKPIGYHKPISEWTEADSWNNYSAKYDVLKAFAEFCRRSGGFLVH